MITIEEYGAFTTSVFAGITLWLVFKTKSLTNLVSEMEKQTTVLVKSYELHNELSLTERIPYFKSGTFYRNPNNIEGSLTLVNHGTSARWVKMFGPSTREINFGDVLNGDEVIRTNDVTFFFRTPNSIREIDFDFTISFISEAGNEFTQDFRVDGGTVLCYSPKVGISKKSK